MAFVNYPNGNAVRMCLNCADALIRQGRGVRDEKKADPEGSAIDENTGNAAHRDEDSISELKSLRETLRDFIAHVNQVFDEFEERISALEAKPSPPATTNVTPLQRK